MRVMFVIPVIASKVEKAKVVGSIFVERGNRHYLFYVQCPEEEEIAQVFPALIILCESALLTTLC